MKNLMKSNHLPVVVFALGAVGLALRWLLYALTVDGRNLIPTGHPLEILLWLVTAAAVVFVVTAVWKLDGSAEYADNFRASPAGALGAAAMAVGIFVTTLLDGLALSGLEMARDVLGWLSATAMICIALFRLKGQKPLFPLHAVVCVFFAIHAVSCYRPWSGNPQLQDYVFTLFASLGLMLFAFYQAGFDADMGKRRMLSGIGLLTAFVCFVSVSGTENTILYLTGGIWTLTNLCSLTPVPPAKQPEE